MYRLVRKLSTDKLASPLVYAPTTLAAVAFVKKQPLEGAELHAGATVAACLAAQTAEFVDRPGAIGFKHNRRDRTLAVSLQVDELAKRIGLVLGQQRVDARRDADGGGLDFLAQLDEVDAVEPGPVETLQAQGRPGAGVDALAVGAALVDDTFAIDDIDELGTVADDKNQCLLVDEQQATF